MESMYGKAVKDADELLERLTKRDQPIVVVAAGDAEAFVPYGLVILEAAENFRKPVFVVIDDGQIFSGATRGNTNEAEGIINQCAERGRMRDRKRRLWGKSV